MRTATEIVSLIFGATAFIFAFGRAFDKIQQRLDKNQKDISGVGQMNRRVIGYLVRYADSEEKRDQVARLIEGR